jgi:hypothetical protein
VSATALRSTRFAAHCDAHSTWQRTKKSKKRALCFALCVCKLQGPPWALAISHNVNTANPRDGAQDICYLGEWALLGARSSWFTLVGNEPRATEMYTVYHVLRINLCLVVQGILHAIAVNAGRAMGGST